MKNNKKSLRAVLFVLIAIIALGIGYAEISLITLTINGTASATASQDNFKVKFDSSSIQKTNATATVVDDLTASFQTTGLTKEGDQAVVTYTIQNTSPDLAATLSHNTNFTNSEYFDVKVNYADSDYNTTQIDLAAQSATTITYTVTVKKTPIDNDVSSTVTTTLTATPKNS